MNKKVTKCSLTLYTILSIVLIGAFIASWIFVEVKWELFIYLTFWSFWSILFYILSITICDWLIYYNISFSQSYLFFVRNHYIRIAMPFAIAVVFLYWILIIMGEQFLPLSGGINILFSIFFHGFICAFGVIDVIIREHYYMEYYGIDILIITGVYIGYVIVVACAKYCADKDAYEFMEISEVRQLVAAGLIIYVIILGAYALFMFVTSRIFNKEDVKIKEEDKVRVVQLAVRRGNN